MPFARHSTISVFVILSSRGQPDSLRRAELACSASVWIAVLIDRVLSWRMTSSEPRIERFLLKNKVNLLFTCLRASKPSIHAGFNG